MLLEDEEKKKHFSSKSPLRKFQLSLKEWMIPLCFFLLIYFLSIPGFRIESKSLSSLQIKGKDKIIVKFQLDGILKAQDGSILSGAKVFLISKNANEKFSTIASETGGFQFSNLSPGEYIIVCELEGDEAFKTTVYVGSDLHSKTLIPTPVEIKTVPICGGVSKEGEVPPEFKKIVKFESQQLILEIPTQKISKTELKENEGLNRIVHEIAQKYKNVFYSFYYSKGSLFAKNGIAKVGVMEKKLNRITTIPYKDEDYNKNVIKIEENCVYCIRLGKRDEGKLIIRVLKIKEYSMEMEYFIVQKKK